MKRLILIRHAKSGWDDPMADDHERVLTERGRKAAQAIGTWLTNEGYLPDMLLVSDATRTIETHKHLCKGLRHAPETTFHPALYHASPDTILDHFQRSSADTTAIIAHNPGIAMAAHGLVRTRPAHHRFSDYPTGATTVIDFAEDIRVGTGTCAAFVVPRDIT